MPDESKQQVPYHKPVTDFQPSSLVDTACFFLAANLNLLRVIERR